MKKTENAGLKMQDQMSGGKNAWRENTGPENQDRKMEDQRSERVYCRGNMRDCVVEKNAVVKQSLSTQCNTMSNTLEPTITLLHYVINYLRNR